MTRHTDFVVRNLFDMGPDYARTLAHWRQRFTHRILKSSASMSASAGCGSTTSAIAKPDLTPAAQLTAAGMTRPAQHLLMALAFDVYWTLVVMLRERGLLIWLTLAIFARLRLPATSRPPALLLAAAGWLDACWALAGLIDFRGDSLLPLWMVALWLMFAVVWTRLTRTATLPGWVLATAATLGGPVAYLIGARLGAMTLLVPTALAVAAMACGWLVIMLLFHLGMGRQNEIRPVTAMADRPRPGGPRRRLAGVAPRRRGDLTGAVHRLSLTAAHAQWSV